MKITTGLSRENINISKVRVEPRNTSTELVINLDVFTKRKNERRPTSRLPRREKSFFILATTSEEKALNMFANGAAAVRYLKNASSYNDVFPQIRGIDVLKKNLKEADNKPAQFQNDICLNHTETLVIEKPNIGQLYLFAGVISSLPKTASVGSTFYNLLSFDSLTILENGAPIPTNTVLFTDRLLTNVWIGSAYRDAEGRWYKGGSKPGGRHSRLYAKEVPNTKVVMQAEMLKILKQQMTTFPAILASLNKKVDVSVRNLNNKTEQGTNYFSPLYSAKTDLNNLSFTYGFNLLDFFKNNGVYSDLIKNEARLMSAFTLNAIRIVRKRVTTNTPTNDYTGLGHPQDFGDKIEFITDKPSFINALGDKAVLLVSATDKNFKDVTFGIYSYGTEMVFVDNTHNVIKNVIDDPFNGLRQARDKLKVLYADCSRENNYDSLSDQLTDAFQNQLSSLSPENKIWITAIKDYFNALNIFYKNLESNLGYSINDLSSQLYDCTNPFTNGPSGVSLLMELIIGLMTSLDTLENVDIAFQDPKAAKKQVSNVLLNNVSRLVKIKHYFDDYIDAEEMTDYGFDYLKTQGNLGVASAINPFKIVRYEEMLGIVSNEDVKLAIPTPPPTSGIFLTPNYIKLNGAQEPLNTNNPDQESKNQLIASSLVAANKLRNSPPDFSPLDIPNDGNVHPTDELKIISNSLKIMAAGGCDITIRRDINIEKLENNEFLPTSRGLFDSYRVGSLENDANLLDAAEKMSEDSYFVINATGTTGNSFPQYSESTKTPFGRDELYNDMMDLNKDILFYLTQTDYFNPSPGHAKSTIKNITDANIFKSVNQDLDSFDQEVLDNAAANIGPANSVLRQAIMIHNPEPPIISQQETNYASQFRSPRSALEIATLSLSTPLRKVQYLAGFRRLNGLVLPNSPIWVDLSRSQLENLSTLGSTVLARLVDHQNGFSPFKGIEAPTYNSLFILGPSGLSFNNNLPVTFLATQIPDSAFRKLNKLVEGGYSQNRFATSFKGDQQLPRALRNENISSRVKNGFNNLYTNGIDYVTSIGASYSGYYHIRYNSARKRNVAMTGPTHTSAPHETLTPVSKRAKAELQQAVPRQRTGRRRDRGSQTTTPNMGSTTGGGGY